MRRALIALLLIATTASASPAPVVYVGGEPLSLVGSPMAAMAVPATVLYSGPSIKIGDGPKAWVPVLVRLLTVLR
jgi:hypothetical protein